MSTFILQRARWSLQISRSSRSFAVSFSTALPQRQRHRNLTSEASTALRSPRRDTSVQHTSLQDARQAFSSAKYYRNRQARCATTAASPAPESSDHQPPPFSERHETTARSIDTGDLTSGLADKPLHVDEGSHQVDWARSFHGLSSEAFSKEASQTLLAPIGLDDIELKPDGIVYLPEIKYRRILNKAFGPGAWGLAPRGETIVTAKAVTREYALVALGRLVSVARGEQDYFSPDGIPTAAEGCKSNALMRCCKDIGIASELWDPRFIRKFMAQYARETWVEHVVTKKKKKIWMRKDDHIRYPFRETKGFGS
ncbi:MAG: hypothetical protein LQ351_004612 [Letrouitia transgressa]|nr:MAG: hypothetical protein LQ351_004612 [Letrouitia transgressa]